jgi:hypothetical protein
VIDTATLSRWMRRARRGALNKLVNLLEFRAMIAEFREEGVLMEAYTEAAAAMLCSDFTLRRNIGVIREYTKNDLVRWIRNGVSFDHFEKAAELAELAKKTPLQLLNECIDPGNATGDTMTVKELQSFALGEQVIHPAVYRFNVLYTRLCNLHNGLRWPEEKIERYEALLNELKGFFDDNSTKT